MDDQKILCAFFSEFHPIAGPKITVQVPENFISKEFFDLIHFYIITKPEIQNSLLTIAVEEYKIIGCPIFIDNPKYERNARIFNICFVISKKSKEILFERLVVKLNGSIKALERDHNFLAENVEQKMTGLLTTVLERINSNLECRLTINDSVCLNLRLARECQSIQAITDYAVPHFKHMSVAGDQGCDDPTRKVLEVIDGVRYVAQIADELQMDKPIVKQVLSSLLVNDVIELHPVFLYDDLYVLTPTIRRFYADRTLQSSCIKFVAVSDERPLPCYTDVFRVITSFTPGTKVRDIAVRFDLAAMNINVKELITFCLRHRILRRLQRYPFMLSSRKTSGLHHPIEKFFNGVNTYDYFCYKARKSPANIDSEFDQINQRLPHDQQIVICLK